MGSATKVIPLAQAPYLAGIPTNYTCLDWSGRLLLDRIRFQLCRILERTSHIYQGRHSICRGKFGHIQEVLPTLTYLSRSYFSEYMQYLRSGNGGYGSD